MPAYIDMDTYDELETYLTRISALTTITLGSDLIREYKEIDGYLAVLRDYADEAMKLLRSIKLSSENLQTP